MGQSNTTAIKSIDLNNFETMSDFKQAIGELKNTHTTLLEAKKEALLERDTKINEFSNALLQYTEAKTIADCKCHGQRLWYTSTQRYQDECVDARMYETTKLFEVKRHAEELQILAAFKESIEMTGSLVEGTINTNSKYISK